MKSFSLKAALALTSAIALTACASGLTKPENSMRLYSPPSLHLKAGTKVETPYGTYIPQVDEIWHSHAAYMDRVIESMSK